MTDRHGYTASKIRTLEAAAMAVQGDDALMQRAAAGLAASAARLLTERRGLVYGARVVIMVGAGNNGGDALYAGARLARRGVQVTAVPAMDRLHEGGRAALVAAGGAVATLEETGLDDLGARPRPLVDLFVDGILGIGGRSGLTGRPASCVAAMGRGSVPVLAVDLPSGVATDTGAVDADAVRATRTVTFGALKPCHLIEPARSHCGEIELVDIGLFATEADLWPDLDRWTDDLVAQAWPFPDATSDKYARGVVGVDTGSEQYPGAGLMSTYGAVYAGAGMVRFLGADRPARLIEAQLPNVVFAAGRVQARLLGSGWGERTDGAAVLAAAVEEGLPAVVDADGLKHLPVLVPETWLLTPHAGELAALVGEDRRWVSDDPLRAVHAAADRTGATVLLKGATQLMARPGREPVLVARPGPAWTAQAGSGDVLAGVCATLLAAGLRAEHAGVLGASVQAAAAAVHPGAIPPHELARTIGTVLGDLQRRRDEITDEQARR